MKRLFSDSLRIERPLSAPDGEAKLVVSTIGRNGIFYASALKPLKKEFGNPYTVAHWKFKAVLNQDQISPEDTVTWLASMGYTSSIKSPVIKAVTKPVMHLP